MPVLLLFPSNAKGMSVIWRVGCGSEVSAYTVQEVGLAWRRESHSLLGSSVKKYKSMPTSPINILPIDIVGKNYYDNWVPGEVLRVIVLPPSFEDFQS